MTIPALLDDHARRHGDRVFLVTGERDFTYAAVAAATAGFAAALVRRGVRPGDHVALAAGNSAGFLVAWFAINRAGAVAVTLNTQSKGESLCYMLSQSDAVAIVADRAWRDERSADLGGALADLPVVLLPTDRDLGTLASGEGVEAVSRSPLDPATILYTSGTTGLPKGVLNSHAAYLAAGRHTVDMLGLTPDDRCMVVLPLFHANPQMYAVMSALQVGSALVLRERFSASTFFDDARRTGATGFTFVGTVLSILAARHPGRQDAHGLRFCLGGGAPLKVWQEVEARFGVTVHELYGMTEIGGWVAANTVSARRLGSCGRIRPDMEVRILDADDRELPAGSAGEIAVRPREPGVILSGYYREPGQMLEACRNLWFHTGDRGFVDADGYLFFQGRSKELIRKGGEMISPAEIETALRKMEAVSDCAAVGVEDEILGQEIKVAVVAAAAIAPAAIREHLAALFPAAMLPRYVEFMTAIPKTETEKIQRHKLAGLGPGVHDLGRP